MHSGTCDWDVAVADPLLDIPTLGEDDDYAHICDSRGPDFERGYCGYDGPPKHSEHNGRWFPGTTHCHCGTPLCPACLTYAEAAWRE